MKSETGEETKSFSWRVPAIDGVRALAMLMVYTFHVWHASGKPSKPVDILGHRIDLLGAFHTFPAGVDLFMVLSGFCLFLPLCKSSSALDKWDVPKYFARRVRRIAPPYYAAIAYAVLMPQVLVVLFRLLGQEAKWQAMPSLWQFFTHALFIHTLFPQTWGGLVPAFWSLGLEAQFYLVFPLVIFGFRRFGTRILWAMIGVSIVYRIAVALWGPQQTDAAQVYTTFFLGRWMQFALGMASAWIVSQHWKAEQERSAKLGTWAIIAAVFLYIAAVSDSVVKITIFPLRDLLLAACFSMAVTALCITRTPLRAVVENKPIVWLGLISYSFFLVHQPTAWYLSELLKKKLHLQGTSLFLMLCSVGFLITLAISYAFFKVFERPFLTSSKRSEPLARPEFLPQQQPSSIQDQAVP